MKQIGWLVIVLLLSACTSGPIAKRDTLQDLPVQANQSDDRVTTFSSVATGELPSVWEPMVIFKHKKRTDYSLVKAQEKTVLRAFSANASSGLMHHVSIEPQTQPWLQWQWRIGTLGERIAHAQDMMEDAPARIILGFDGDKGSLSFAEQILFETAKIITGYDFPYATLMYEWHGTEPTGTIRQSKRSSRIRSLIVESGDGGVGQWRTFERNIVEDFERAYGEKPGRLIGVGILTDSDYTGETVETWYGDIRLHSQNK